jgi:hypothetical protein
MKFRALPIHGAPACEAETDLSGGRTFHRSIHQFTQPEEGPMKKLALKLDELNVVSFEPTAATGEEGTVKGQEEVQFSYAWSCNNTCADTNCGKSYCVSSPCAC